jgi:hypothetical protein
VASGVISVIALVLSLLNYRREQARATEETAARRRAFADRVTWWTSVQVSDEDQLPYAVFHINNANEAPAYNVVLVITVDRQNPEMNWDLGTVPPGLHRHEYTSESLATWEASRDLQILEYVALHNAFAEGLYFREPAGRRWVRGGDGSLRPDEVE